MSGAVMPPLNSPEQKPEASANNKPKLGPAGASDAVLVYATFPNSAEAEAVAAHLVDLGLVACANILPSMTSIYRWQGKRQKDTEVVMLMKTRGPLAGRVTAEIVARHSYETPAVVVFPIIGGSQMYLDWIAAETTKAMGPTDDAS